MRNLAVSPLEDICPVYHMVVVSLGYEERARYLAERYGPHTDRKIAWAFSAPRCLSYSDNEKWLTNAGFAIVDESKGRPAQWLEEASQNLSPDDVLRVCVDISSATRGRLAAWIDAIRSTPVRQAIEADFFYTQACFVPPPSVPATNTYAGPVSHGFAGWTTDPDLRSLLILGLGYEPDRAIGAVEYLEPGQLIAFEPVSRDQRFSEALATSNAPLWGLKPAPRRILYNVERPFETFMLLEALVGRAAQRSRPVILPFGPKVFALCSLLVASFHPATAVWRVSAGADEVPLQRTPTGGKPVGIRLRSTV